MAGKPLPRAAQSAEQCHSERSAAAGGAQSKNLYTALCAAFRDACSPHQKLLMGRLSSSVPLVMERILT